MTTYLISDAKNLDGKDPLEINGTQMDVESEQTAEMTIQGKPVHFTWRHKNIYEGDGFSLVFEPTVSSASSLTDPRVEPPEDTETFTATDSS